MWRNWQIDKDVEKRESLCTVGRLLIHAATMKNSMMVPQKIKSRTTIWSSNLISGYICKAKERDICTFMFIAALFTTAKIRKQTKCPSVVCTHNEILFSHWEEENPAIYGYTDRTYGHYAKWDKTARERQTLHGIYLYVDPKKKVKFIETENRKCYQGLGSGGDRKRLVKGFRL